MNTLFEQTDIKGMRLKNRLVRSATEENMADENGLPTESLIRFYSRLAKGGVGLIITGFIYVDERGKPVFENALGMTSSDGLEGYGQLVAAAHDNGAKIAAQLAHSGRQTTAARLNGEIPLSASDVYDPFYKTHPQAMTDQDIEAVINKFVKAAARAKSLGFDAVQIHCAPRVPAQPVC